jgi:hypothetical protein
VVHRFSWYVERLLRFSRSDPLYRAVLELKRSLCHLEAALIDIILERTKGDELPRKPAEELSIALRVVRQC